MIGKKIIIIFIGILWGINLFSQCPEYGAVFVNEIFNANGSGKEYIELVVVGDPSSPTSPVNLEGWIIDDNNIDQTGQGTATGHLKLDNTFSSVNPGAIILIYNENDPPAGIPSNNPPWLYVVAGSDIDGCSSSPNTSNSSYTPCGTPGGSYSYVLMANGGDIMQTRDASIISYHALRYGGVNVAADVNPVDVSDKSIGLDCGDWFDGNNYTITTQTPGEANSTANLLLINSIRNGTIDCSNINLSCVAPCPEINGISINPASVCEFEDFSVTASPLANMGQSANQDKDFGIEFVYFTGAAPPADAYSGGTSLGVVPYGSLTGTDPNQQADLTVTGGTMSPGTYNICAILDQPSANDCNPQQCEVIEINDSPEASLSGTIEFCPQDCYEINVVIQNGTDPYDASFLLVIGSINLPFDIPAYNVNSQLTICYSGNIIPYYDSGSNTLYVPLYITGTGSLFLTSLVDDNGCEAQNINPDYLTLIFKDKLGINNAGPLQECDDDHDGQATFDLTVLDNDLTGGATNQSSNWYEDVNCTTVISDPTSFTTPTTSVYVFLSDDTGDKCNSDTIPVDLIVIEFPDPGEDSQVDVCNTETCFNLFYNLGGGPEQGGSWSDDDNTGVNMNLPECVDFTSIQSGTYNFSYTTQDQDGFCDAQTSTITINLAEPGNPGQDGEDSFCGSPLTPVDLEIYIGNDFDTNGTWYSPDGFDVSDPNNVDMSGASSGTYSFFYQIENTPCPLQESKVTIYIIDPPNAGNDSTIYICNDGINTIASLGDALGIHDNNGDWFDIDTSGVDLSDPYYVDFGGVNADTFHFNYVIPDNIICPEDEAVVTVIVESAPFAGNDGYSSICVGSLDTFNLYDYLGGSFDSTGVWIQTGGDSVDISIPDTVLFYNINIGIDSFVYITSGSCGNDSAFVYIDITASPYAGEDFSYIICENSYVNLFDSLVNYNIGGIWINNNNDTISDPNTLFIDSAGVYEYLYILPQNGTCLGDTAIGIITALAAPEAGVGIDFSICQSSAESIDLYEYLTGYSQSGGIWTDQYGNIIGDPYNYSFSTYDTGQYIIKYMLPDNGYCNSDTAQFTVFVVSAPNAGNDNNFIVCNSNLNNTVNMDALLGNHDPVGYWLNIDNVNVDLSDSKKIDFSGVNTGIYRFEYKIDVNGSCPADSAMITIEVKKKINAGIDKTLTFCEGGNASVNIITELIPDPNTLYVIEDLDLTNAINITTGNIDISLLPIGKFKFRLTTGTQDLCGTDTSVLAITIVEAFKAGNDNFIEICNDESTLDIDTLLGYHDPGGVWIDLDNSLVDIQSSNGKNVSFLDHVAGIYRYEYKIESSGTCPESSAIITVKVNEVSTYDFNKEICAGQSINIGSNVYDLNNPIGTEILSNAFGCDSIINIALTEKITSSYVSIEDANCFGFGKFSLTSLENVQYPVQLIIQNKDTYQVNNVPFVIDDLIPGNYSFDIIDFDGCVVNNISSFTINDFVPYNIEINVTENQDNYILDIDTDINPESIKWTPSTGLSCSDCISTVAKPDSDTEYIVVITDSEGCMVSDTVLLKSKITEVIDIEIPNVFTPDGDGYNEIFYVKSNLENINYDMFIYDRWGEKIYFGSGLKFNDSTGGWDGTFRNTKALPGVYVYVIIINFNNDKKETFTGDILLLR